LQPNTTNPVKCTFKYHHFSAGFRPNSFKIVRFQLFWDIFSSFFHLRIAFYYGLARFSAIFDPNMPENPEKECPLTHFYASGALYPVNRVNQIQVLASLTDTNNLFIISTNIFHKFSGWGIHDAQSEHHLLWEQYPPARTTAPPSRAAVDDI
jgi:hypothetical protein